MLRENDNEEDCLNTIKEQTQKTEKLYEVLEKSLLGPQISNCSCPECDSLRCFTIRRELAKSACACNDCKQSNTCLLQFNDKSRESKPILKVRKSEDNPKSSQKSVDFCDKTNFHEIIRMEHGEIDRTIHSEFYYTSDNHNFKDSNSPLDTSYTRVQSAVLSYPKKNISKTTAQLSAQIMNVPIQDFKNSLSVDSPREKIGSEITQNAKQDIFSRLKEIYKACSCKVCECIPVSSFFTRPDVCSCKPCECSECKHVYQYVSNIKETPHGGCPCIRCDRKDCRGISKTIIDQKNCTCKRCDCIKCSESFSKSCSCDPCKCLECRNMPSYLARSVVVAPVENIQSRNLCDCSPCECSNCTHNYNTTSNLRETSTGTVAHSFCPCETCANDVCQTDGATCRCEINKGIMKKPIQRDRHEYDIRRMLIADAWPSVAEDKNKRQPDIITMHAKIQQNRLGVNVKQCQCDECNCVACTKQNMKRKLVFSKRPSILNLPCLKNVCRCEPCECDHCSKDILRSNESKSFQDSKCECKICDCINCANLEDIRNTHKPAVDALPLRHEFIASSVPNQCNCSPCECIDCQKYNIDLVYQNVPTHENVTTERKITFKSSENFDDNELDERRSQKPSKPFLKAMTRGSNIQPSRSTKVSKSKQRVAIHHAQSEHDITSESSIKMLDCNTDNSVTYFSAENSNIEVTIMDDEVFNGKRREVLYLDNSTIDGAKSPMENVSLFYEKPKIICVNTEVSQKKLASLHFQDGFTVQPFVNIPEFETDQYYTISEPSNNCAEYSYQQFFPSCTENIATLKGSITPYYPLQLNSSPYKYNVRFDYDRVLSTLQDAQEFQGKLNDILQTYEAANNNFISISQRLKDVQENICSNKDNESVRSNILSLQFQRTNYNSLVGDTEYPNRHDESPGNFFEFSSTSGSSTETETKLKPILGSHNLLENIDWVEFQRAIRKPDGCEDVYGDVTKSEKSNSNKTMNVTSSRINKKYKIHHGFNKHTKEVMKRMRPNSKVRVLSSKQISHNIETIPPPLSEKPSFSSADAGADDTEQQDISLNTDVTFLFKDADFYKDVGTVSDIIDVSKLQDLDITANHEILPSHPMPEEENKTQTEALTIEGIITPSNILKKNLYMHENDERTENKCILKFPPMEANLKEVIGIISNDLKQESTAKIHKCLDSKVNSNVRHCLNRLVSSVIFKCELKKNARSTLNRHRSSKTANVKPPRRESKHDCLKASFEKLQRVSDHTVLVKWNTPRNISEVQGYEVDGRAVQKIFSPTRSIAVVTCLPHSDKVLLSIRTLTSNSECNPTTTTVYHPRSK